MNDTSTTTTRASGPTTTIVVDPTITTPTGPKTTITVRTTATTDKDDDLTPTDGDGGSRTTTVVGPTITTATGPKTTITAGPTVTTDKDDDLTPTDGDGGPATTTVVGPTTTTGGDTDGGRTTTAAAGPTTTTDEGDDLTPTDGDGGPTTTTAAGPTTTIDKGDDLTPTDSDGDPTTTTVAGAPSTTTSGGGNLTPTDGDGPSTTTPRDTVTLPPVLDCNGPDTDILFLLDSSGGKGSDNFEVMLQFVQNIVKDIDVDSGRMRVALITFGGYVRVHFDLNTYHGRVDIIDAVDEVYYSRGSTNTEDALTAMTDQIFTTEAGSRAHARKLGILITDSHNSDKDKVVDETEDVKSAGIHMMVIAIGRWYDLYEVQAIATYPQETNLIFVNDFKSLDTKRDVFVGAACYSEYKVNYFPGCTTAQLTVYRFTGCTTSPANSV